MFSVVLLFVAGPAACVGRRLVRYSGISCAWLDHSGILSTSPAVSGFRAAVLAVSAGPVTDPAALTERRKDRKYNLEPIIFRNYILYLGYYVFPDISVDQYRTMILFRTYIIYPVNISFRKTIYLYVCLYKVIRLIQSDFQS